jgi:hypothetical protein
MAGGARRVDSAIRYMRRITDQAQPGARIVSTLPVSVAGDSSSVTDPGYFSTNFWLLVHRVQ